LHLPIIRHIIFYGPLKWFPNTMKERIRLFSKKSKRVLKLKKDIRFLSDVFRDGIEIK